MDIDNKEIVLKCSACGEKIRECDVCGEGLGGIEPIICFAGGEHHFCSEKCMEAFLDDSVIEAETYLDNV